MENVAARDGDEELSLFLEIRRREKARSVSSLSETGANSFGKATTGTERSVLTTTRCVHLRKSAFEKFLDSENNKSDYEWLLAAAPPHETLAQENSMFKLKEPKAISNVLKPRVENIPQELVTRSSEKASKPITRRQKSSVAIIKQANNSFAEPKPNSKPSRQATPASRTTLLSTRKTNSAMNSNPESSRRASSTKSNPALTRSSSVGKSVPSLKSTSLTIREIPARPVSASRSRATVRSKISNNDVNPVLMGTQMVERVVNMRKLPPPKQDDHTSSGFGRTLSKSSLEMAMRHMNIRRSSSISENPRVTTINSLKTSMEKSESSTSSLIP
ncbi:unnamed protein product [Cochlearia groenlandica]